MQIILSQRDVLVAIAGFIHDRFIPDEDTDVVINLKPSENEVLAVVDIMPSNPDVLEDADETEEETAVSGEPVKRRKRRTKAEIEAEAAASEQPAFTPEKDVPIAAAEPVSEPAPWEPNQPEPAEDVKSDEPSFTEAAPTVGSDSSSTSQETPIADTAPSQTEIKAAPSIFPNVVSSAPELPKVEPAVAAKSLFANLVKPTAH